VEGPLSTGEGFQRWTIDVGMRHEFTLSLVPRDMARGPEPLVLVRQELIYELGRPESRVRARFDLEVLHQAIGELRVDMDRGVTVEEVRLGDVVIPWRVIEAEGSPAVVAELPDPLIGSGQLTIRGVIGLAEGSAWTLPRLRARHVFWQAGRATVRVYPPLTIQQIQPSECRPIAMARLPSDGRELVFQYFDSDARIEAQLGPTRAEARAKVAQVLQFSATETTLVGTIHWTVSSGRLFHRRCRVPPGWRVVQVEAVGDAGRVRDWHMQAETPPARAPAQGGDDHAAGPIRHDPSQPPQRQILDVELAAALSPDRPLTLGITAHRDYNSASLPTQPEPIPLFRPLDVSDVEGLVAVVGRGAVEVEIERTRSLRPVEPDAVDETWRRLFGQIPSGSLLGYRGRAGAGQIRTLPRRVAYSAEVVAVAHVETDRVEHDWRIRCTAGDEALDQIFVAVTPPTEGAVRWLLAPAPGAGPAAGALRARRLEPAAAAVWQLPAGSAVWELAFPEPAENRVELVAHGSHSWADGSPLSLPVPLAADEFDGLALVAPRPDVAVHVQNSGAVALPLAAAPAEILADLDASTTQAFAYGSATSRLALRRDEGERVDAVATIRRARIESIFNPSGVQNHRVVYRVDGAAPDELNVRLPPEGRPLAAAVNGRQQPVGVDHGRFCLRLPRGERGVAVTLDYAIQHAPWNAFPVVRVLLPVPDLPVHAVSWHIAVPPGFELLESPPDLQTLAPSARSRSWRRRLFGPLARRVGAERFNPFALRDWADLFRPDRAPQPTAAQLSWATRLDEATRSVARSAGPADERDLAALVGHLAARPSELPALLIDAPAVAESGLGPATPIDGRADSLAKSGLSALLGDGAVVLTTRAEAARLAAWLDPLSDPGISLIAPSPLADEVRRAAEEPARASARFVPGLAWIEQNVGAGAETSPRFAQRAGDWPVARFSGIGGPTELRLRFARRTTVVTMSWGLLLFVAALGFVGFGRAPAWHAAGVAAILLVACGGALLLPDALTPFSAALALARNAGGAFGLRVRWQRSHDAAPRSSNRPGAATAILPKATLGVLALLLVGGIGLAWAQPSPSGRTQAEAQDRSQPAAPARARPSA
ncbi:MAG: hypothetical protein ACOC46_02160, partial [Pirellulales bacterium]